MSEMQTDLLPCPFCRNRHPLRATVQVAGAEHVITCLSCNLVVSAATFMEVTERWNTRPNVTIAQLEMQILGLKYMINTGKTWAEMLQPKGHDGTKH